MFASFEGSDPVREAHVGSDPVVLVSGGAALVAFAHLALFLRRLPGRVSGRLARVRLTLVDLLRRGVARILVGLVGVLGLGQFEGWRVAGAGVNDAGRDALG
jgi:hypothetical protein